MSNRYHYTRNGSVFTVGSDGVSVVDENGRTTVDVPMTIPDDVIASTILDLCRAGWTWQETPDKSPEPSTK